jgi:hypothetical protein
MTLLGLTLTQLATIFAAVGGAVTLLYILKLRRRRISVPFAQLWQRVLKERQSDSLFRRLKRLLSLLLQLAFLFLLVAALGNPRLSTQVISQRRIIMLVDASASMKSADAEEGTRMKAALKKARELVSGLSGSDVMMIVRMDAQITPLTAFTSDTKTLFKALDGLKPTDTRADISRGLKFCADALRGRKNPMLIIVGDGAYERKALASVRLDDRSGKQVKVVAKKPDTKKPDSKKPDSKKPDSKKPDSKKPDSKKPDAKKPKLAKKPDAKKPKKPEKPDAKKPKLAKKPDAKKPDDKKAKATKKPDAKKPKLAKKTKRGPKSLASDLDRISLEGVTVHFIGVGKSKDNVGIVAFNARRYPTNKLSFEVFLEVVNYRKKKTEVDLQLLSDGAINDVKRLVLAPGQRARYTCSPSDRKAGKKSWCDMAASGELLEARLVKPGSSDANDKGALDAFPLDDRAYALLPKRRKLRVLLVSTGNLFLEGALLLDENTSLERIPPAAYSAKRTRGMDAVVFDSWVPDDWTTGSAGKSPGKTAKTGKTGKTGKSGKSDKSDKSDKRSSPIAPKATPGAAGPKAHVLLVNPPAGKGPFGVAGRIARPFITEQSEEHPVMRFITLKDVNISDSAKFKRKRGDVVLAASLRDPVLIARDTGRYKRVAFGFNPKRSDLPLRVAFPLLVINTLNWFSGESEGLITTYRAGDTWQVPLGPVDDGNPRRDFVEVKNPLSELFKAPVSGSYAVLNGRHVGVYQITDGKAKLRIAANLADPLESNIAPAKELILGGRLLAPPAGFSVKLRREIWIYLLLIGLGLILLEWLTYNRRLTV